MYLITTEKKNGAIGLILRRNLPNLRVYQLLNETDKKRFNGGVVVDTIDMLALVLEGLCRDAIRNRQ